MRNANTAIGMDSIIIVVIIIVVIIIINNDKCKTSLVCETRQPQPMPPLYAVVFDMHSGDCSPAVPA
jgi:hypothetical protein